MRTRLIPTILASACLLLLAAGPAAAGDDANATFHSQLARADKLLGADVMNTSGKKLGTIDELVMDASRQRVSYAVLAFGGFLGMNENQRAVPWEALHIRGQGAADGDLKIELHATEDQIKSAPAFNRDRWPDTAPGVWDVSGTGTYPHQWQGDQAHRDDTAPRAGDLDHQSDRDRNPTAVAVNTGVSADMMDARRVSEVTDKDVKNASGKTIGEIEDLVVDTNRGDIAYALVKTDDDVVDLADQFAAIPWRALDRQQDAFTVAIGNDVIKQLAIRDDSLAALGDMATARHRAELTHSDPYWLRGETRYGSAASGDRTSGTEYGSQQGGSDSSGMMTVSGTVKDVSSASGGAGGKHMRLELRTDDGRTVAIDCANLANGDQQKPRVKQGDRITVTGRRRTDASGETTIMAETIRNGQDKGSSGEQQHSKSNQRGY